MKIRDGNDFKLNWALIRGGVVEDISGLLSGKLLLRHFREVTEIKEKDYKITGNIISIEFKKGVYTDTGDYNLEFHYVLPDITFSDGQKACAVDVNSFTIVSKTEQADDPSEFTITSDLAIAFQGKDAHQLWIELGNVGTIEDYQAWLREPSVTAGAYAVVQGDYAKQQGDYISGLQILNTVEYLPTEFNEV